MSKAELIEKAPISLTKLKEELNRIQKRDEEMSFRAGKALDYINSFAVTSKKKHSEAKSQIEALNVPRLKDVHISKILDFMPKSVNELGVILQGYTLTVTKDNMAKIVQITKNV